MDAQQLLKLEAEQPDKLAGYLVGNRLEDVERSLIQATLRRCVGNKTMASAILGIHPKTLGNKLRKYEQLESDE